MTRRLVGASESSLLEASAARIPIEELPRLAPVRRLDGVKTATEGSSVWVGWDRESSSASEVVRCLMAARGVEFYVRRGSIWAMCGRRVPTSIAPPITGWKSVDVVLVPDRIGPTAPPQDAFTQVRLSVVVGGTPKPATALKCTISELSRWSETATTAQIAALSAARRGETTILRANLPPPIAQSVRFWGESVFLPIGMRANPELAPEVLRAAVGVRRDELLFLDESGADVVPESAFTPLTRAGIRLALEGSTDSP